MLHNNIKSSKIYPRILIIDSFPAGYLSATGKVKAMFIEKWPDDKVLQVCVDLASESLAVVEGKGSPTLKMTTGREASDLLEQCRDFSPELIYFRPNEYELIFSIAQKLIDNIDCPHIIHMMDDWPERLRVNNPKVYKKLNPILNKLINSATRCLSISEKMSATYAERYGRGWTMLANAVDINDFQRHTHSKAADKNRDFVIRYSGGLADDMTFQSVIDIAETISKMREKHQICFEICTMKWYLGKAQFLDKMQGVTVAGLVPDEDYKSSLMSADALVIAYNFDPESIRYTGLSLANKLPEYLASGTPVLAYGPLNVATIDYLQQAACVKVVSRRDPQLLQQAILALLERPDDCARLGRTARDFVSKNSTKDTRQDFFRAILNATINEAINSPAAVSRLIKLWKKLRV